MLKQMIKASSGASRIQKEEIKTYHIFFVIDSLALLCRQCYILVVMFETTSDISVKDNQSEYIQTPSQPLSLPLIPAKPASRGETSMKKEFVKKQKLFLPNIKENQDPGYKKRQEEDVQSRNNEVVYKNAFALQVQEKLKRVLGGMKNNEQEYEARSFDEDENLDFEAQVNRNKQIIKEHKIKKENEKKVEKEQIGSKPYKGQKNRNQSLYEKRAREYRNQSVQNKYLSRKKKNMKEMNGNNISRQSSKNIKSKQEYDAKAGGVKRVQDNKDVNRALSHKGSHKDLIQINKSVNLFDGIQNFLENPILVRKQSKNRLIGLSLLKAKRDIEDKIKIINEKLGVAQRAESDSPVQKITGFQNISRNWRRISFKEKQVLCQQSNFEKQLDKITSLQQRNCLSLEHYMEYQKILLELQLHKQSVKHQQTNSH